MKPKDLKRPFSWEERKVLLQDGVLFVPEYYNRYEEFVFPGWPAIFGNDKPVCLEYCSGNGHWIERRAIEQPEFNWVGVEKRFDRVRKIWSKRENRKIDNLFVICGEALLSTQLYLQDETFHQIYINFPDPWPKEKHAKNRIVQQPFVSEMERILEKEGTATIVTDDVPYSEQVIAEMRQGNFESIYPAPYYVNEREDYGSSWFEELWREKGRAIRYHEFKKNSA